MSPTIGGALRIARSTLSAFLDDREAEKEARMILAHVTGRSQASLLAEPEKALEGAAHRDLKKALIARQNRQPLSQVLGSTEFYGRCFSVTRDVLTPRPDTETLIEVALRAPFTRVLDLGTGSGCILATLLAERPAATGVGTDVSDAALGIASSNLAALGLQDRATLRKSDWLAEVDGPYDLIVSNPPYIAVDELPDLAPEVRDWEPHLALSPGGDGLGAYRLILKDVSMYLSEGGRVIVEVGHMQGKAVSNLFGVAGLEDVRCHPDLSGRDRVVSGRLP